MRETVLFKIIWEGVRDHQRALYVLHRDAACDCLQQPRLEIRRTHRYGAIVADILPHLLAVLNVLDVIVSLRMVFILRTDTDPVRFDFIVATDGGAAKFPPSPDLDVLPQRRSAVHGLKRITKR